MKKSIIALLLLLPLSVGAINITVPQATQYGDVLVGKTNGQYTPTATSSLGIQSPLTFGDGLTETSGDVDCDTASASTFGCLASGMFTEFNNKVGSSSLPLIYSLTGLGSIGSSTATTTFPGNVDITGTLRVIDRIIATTLYVVTEVFYNGLTGPNFTATSTSVASIFPYASTTSISASNSICFGSDCRTSWATAVGNLWGTSTNVTNAIYPLGATRVGIGTAAPLSLLSLYKSQSGLTTVGNARVIALQNSSGATNELQEIGFGFQATSGNYSQPVVIGHRVTSGSSNSMGNFYIATRSVTTDTFPTERLTVTAAGDVGVGTSSPQAKLAISGGNILLENNRYLSAYKNGGAVVNLIGINTSSQTQIDSGSGNNIIFRPSGSTAVTFSSAGLVGIGTTSPDYLLTIGNSAGLANNKIAIDSAAAHQSSIVFRSDGVDRWFIGRGDSDVLPVTTFFIGNTSGGTNNDPGGASAKFVIDANANVGIGTTTPSRALSVQAISPGVNPIALFATSTATNASPSASSSQFWVDFDGIAKVKDWFGNLAKYTSGAGMWQQTATSSAYSISKESEVDQVLTSYNFKFTEARTNPWVEVSGSIDNSGICPSGDDPTLKVVMTTTSTGQTNAAGVHVITRSGSWDVPVAGERIGACQAEDTNSSGTLYCEFDVGRAGLTFNYGSTVFLNVVAADFDDTDCIVGLSAFRAYFH